MKTIIQDFKIEDVISKYEKELRMDGIMDTSEVIYNSENKKDVSKDGRVRCFFVNLDNLVREIIKKNEIKSGFVVCSSKHTTSSVYVNHFEPGAMNDLLDLLRDLYPANKKYKHNEWDYEYKNGDAHLKAIQMGKSATVIISDGELVLGDFENIIYAEFDKRAGKSINIAVFGE